jgi:NNP family nitrate/nitrite transporter-like MFS transporter
MNDIADAKASFAEQAVIFQRKHNWLMCWLYTGTFGSSSAIRRLPAARQDASSRTSTRCNTPSSGRWSARCRAGDRLGRRSLGRRARHLLGVRRHDRSARSVCLYFLGDQGLQPGAFWGFFAMFMLLFFAPASAMPPPSR